jgi:hypothetical protein
MHPCRLKRFIGFHERKDRWEPFRQHRFTRPRRADHQNVMPTGCRNFQRPFRMFLTFHITIVLLFRGTGSEKIIPLFFHWLNHGRTLDERNGFGKRVERIHDNMIHHCSFLAVVCRQD